jgi:glycosyltransferase involved in cell wall biosynthesis
MKAAEPRGEAAQAGDAADRAHGGTAPVTVIVPTYNRGALIGQALDSLLGQTLPPREVIVVVDGSTDDTMAVLGGYGERIRVVRTENGGKARALNLGLSMVSQPFVWIFDDDDVACPDALQRLYPALSARPEAGFSYGTLDTFLDAWPSPVTEPRISYQSESRCALYIAFMQDFFIWQGAMLARTECYGAVGGFDERFTRSQDYEMALRLLRRFSGVAVPHVIFHQRHHGGDRGPSHARHRAADIEARWADFHRMIAREIHDTHRLEEFCCLPDGQALDARSTVTALIQRAVIMARTGVWDRATADMAEAAGLASALPGFDLNPQEVTGLRSVFQHGTRSQFGSLREARSFRAAIGRFDREAEAKVLGNLLLPVSNRAKLLPGRPQKLQEARQIGLIARVLLGPPALREYLAARRSEHRLFGIQPLVARGSA